MGSMPPLITTQAKTQAEHHWFPTCRGADFQSAEWRKHQQPRKRPSVCGLEICERADWTLSKVELSEPR